VSAKQGADIGVINAPIVHFISLSIIDAVLDRNGDSQF